RSVAAYVRLLARLKLEEDRQRDLIFEPALLQSAALLFDDEPREIAQGLPCARHCDLNRVTETLVRRADDLRTFEDVFAHERFRPFTFAVNYTSLLSGRHQNMSGEVCQASWC